MRFVYDIFTLYGDDDMRLRNVPGSREIIEKDEYAIKDPEQYKGCWRSLFNRPDDSKLHIEIGMGKGQFLSTLAGANPDILYVGIEKFSSVIIRALEKLNELEYDNIYVIRFDAENIISIFGDGEIDRIYLNFSDPWPKERHAKRRLTSSNFLKRYDKILSKDGEIIFKTDNRSLFDFSLQQAGECGWNICDITYDLHNSTLACGNVMTEYEEKFVSMGMPIYEMVINR